MWLKALFLFVVVLLNFVIAFRTVVFDKSCWERKRADWFLCSCFVFSRQVVSPEDGCLRAFFVRKSYSKKGAGKISILERKMVLKR
jgi:hypothetical protein